MMNSFYEWLINIRNLDFSDKTAMIIGGSEISRQYVLALLKLGLKDITVIAKTGDYISEFCKENKINLLTGGFEKNISSIENVNITIVAPPIPQTVSATKIAIENGQKNILMEKPGSLYHQELSSMGRLFSSLDIRVGYNRLVYPNYHKLKDLVKSEGGITSCRFTFTERLGTINFEKDEPEVYKRWGISNSLHVITMAFELIGMPEEIHPYQYGSIDWHPSGSIFVGDGLSKQNIPFTYHADWGSGGRWGIEVNTKENSYQLIPLEDLYSCKKDTGTWNKVLFDKAYPDIKQGIVEELAIMLENSKEYRERLLSLHAAAEYNRIAGKIFGYN